MVADTNHPRDGLGTPQAVGGWSRGESDWTVGDGASNTTALTHTPTRLTATAGVLDPANGTSAEGAAGTGSVHTHNASTVDSDFTLFSSAAHPRPHPGAWTHPSVPAAGPGGAAVSTGGPGAVPAPLTDLAPPPPARHPILLRITRQAAMEDVFTGQPNSPASPSPPPSWIMAGVNTTLSNHTTDNGTFFDYDYNDTYNTNSTVIIDVLKGYPYPSEYNWLHIILASLVVTVIMLVIVLGNGLVIWAISVDRNLKGVQNWFIASLAVSDLFVGLFIMPLTLANEMMGYWYFGNILCELWLATDVLLCTASILNLCLISLDRYWSVTRAITYIKQRTKKRALVMIVVVWGLAMTICFPPLAGWKRPQPIMHDLYPLCILSEEPGYVLYSVVGSFYLPCAVMVMVYIKIFLAAKRLARRNLKKPPASGNHATTDNGRSTTTTTTTSFARNSEKGRLEAGGDGVHRLSPPRETSSEDDTSHTPSGGGHSGVVLEPEVAVTTDSGPEPPDASHIKMSVTNRNALIVPKGEERRKLLSDDTDSACETPVLGQGARGGGGGGGAGGGAAGGGGARRIHFCEETDSCASDYGPCGGGAGRRATGSRGGEDNLTPLLEDSQLESDSQRESDRNSNKLSGVNHNSALSVSTDMSGMEGGGTPECRRAARVAGGDHDHHGEGEGEGASGEGSANHLHHAHHAHHMQHLNPRLLPSGIRNLSTSMIRKHHHKEKKHVKDDPERQKRKIARLKERRAFIVLGIIMATFIGCWIPFFFLYPLSILTGLQIPKTVFGIIFWLGYCNSALNPIIYTIFNKDYKQAFHKIICGRRSGRM